MNPVLAGPHLHAIRPCELPPAALLGRYAGSGGHADCYVTEVPGTVSHARYVEAFYTTGIFKIERLILRLLAARPSTDVEARQLAEGARASFAAWTVEARAADQLLLADFTGRTRSWLMVATPQAAAFVTWSSRRRCTSCRASRASAPSSAASTSATTCG